MWKKKTAQRLWHTGQAAGGGGVAYPPRPPLPQRWGWPLGWTRTNADLDAAGGAPRQIVWEGDETEKLRWGPGAGVALGARCGCRAGGPVRVSRWGPDAGVALGARCGCGAGGPMRVWRWGPGAGVALGARCGCGAGGPMRVWRWGPDAGVALGARCGCGAGGPMRVWRWGPDAGVALGARCGCGAGGPVRVWRWGPGAGVALGARCGCGAGLSSQEKMVRKRLGPSWGLGGGGGAVLRMGGRYAGPTGSFQRNTRQCHNARDRNCGPPLGTLSDTVDSGGGGEVQDLYRKRQYRWECDSRVAGP